MPAFMHIMPFSFSTINMSEEAFTTFREACNTSSTKFGSLSVVFASFLAFSDGLTFFNWKTLPSALETIFWATTRMSPSSMETPCFCAVLIINSAKSSPFFTDGKPARPIMLTVSTFFIVKSPFHTVSGFFWYKETAYTFIVRIF